MIIDCEPGNEKWIQWAKSKLADLTHLRVQLGLPKLQRAWKPQTGVLVWLKSATGGDAIKITGNQLDGRAPRAFNTLTREYVYESGKLVNHYEGGIDFTTLYAASYDGNAFVAPSSFTTLNVQRRDRQAQTLNEVPFNPSTGSRCLNYSTGNPYTINKNDPDNPGLQLSNDGTLLLVVTTPAGVGASLGLANIYTLNAAQLAEEDLPRKEWSDDPTNFELQMSGRPALLDAFYAELGQTPTYSGNNVSRIVANTFTWNVSGHWEIFYDRLSDWPAMLAVLPYATYSGPANGQSEAKIGYAVILGKYDRESNAWVEIVRQLYPDVFYTNTDLGVFGILSGHPEGFRYGLPGALVTPVLSELFGAGSSRDDNTIIGRLTLVNEFKQLAVAGGAAGTQTRLWTIVPNYYMPVPPFSTGDGYLYGVFSGVPEDQGRPFGGAGHGVEYNPGAQSKLYCDGVLVASLPRYFNLPSVNPNFPYGTNRQLTFVQVGVQAAVVRYEKVQAVGAGSDSVVQPDDAYLGDNWAGPWGLVNLGDGPRLALSPGGTELWSGTLANTQTPDAVVPISGVGHTVADNSIGLKYYRDGVLVRTFTALNPPTEDDVGRTGVLGVTIVQGWALDGSHVKAWVITGASKLAGGGYVWRSEWVKLGYDEELGDFKILGKYSPTAVAAPIPDNIVHSRPKLTNIELTQKEYLQHKVEPDA